MRAYLPKRGPLCENMEYKPEAYRFTWQSSFHGDAVVEITNGKNIIVEWARNSLGASGRCWCCLGEVEWKHIEAAVLAAGFWALDSMLEFDFGVDGAKWLIEGRRHNVYRGVRRWSPRAGRPADRDLPGNLLGSDLRQLRRLCRAQGGRHRVPGARRLADGREGHRGARVPVGQSWAFTEHRSMAEVIADETAQTA